MLLIFVGAETNASMVVQEDTIFVCGMTVETTESEINEHFGAIGIIKVI